MTNPRTPTCAAASLTLGGGHWRIWTAFLTVIAFVFLLSTVATHHHNSSLAEEGCALCGAVSNKISGAPLVPAATPIIIHFLYSTPVPVVTEANAFPSPLCLPPSCGPPAQS